MKILHIIPSLCEGGAERMVLDICIELKKRKDIEVTLVYFRDINDYPVLSSQIECLLIPSKYIPSISGKTVTEIDGLMNFIRGFKPDIIHTHLFEAELISRIEIMAGVKYFSHCHDNMHQLKPFSINTLFSKKNLTEFYERIIMIRQYKKCNNSFIAISKHAENYFKQVLPFSLANRIYLRHNAIDFYRFNKVNKQRNARPVKLINVGSFVAKKNQQFLVDVVKILTDGGHDVALTMLGGGALRADVLAKVSAMGLGAHIALPGNVEDVPGYLAEATIYVHAATYEPFGLVLIEAMAAGLPVVCLDGGGNRDIMEQNKNGLMVHQPDAKLFAEAILQVADNQNAYNEMSAYAVAYAARFDIKPYADRLLELYRGEG